MTVSLSEGWLDSSRMVGHKEAIEAHRTVKRETVKTVVLDREMKL